MVFSVPVPASLPIQSLGRLPLSLLLTALSYWLQNRPAQCVPSCDGFSSIHLGSVPAVPTPLLRNLHVFRYSLWQPLLLVPGSVLAWCCWNGFSLGDLDQTALSGSELERLGSPKMRCQPQARSFLLSYHEGRHHLVEGS